MTVDVTAQVATEKTTVGDQQAPGQLERNAITLVDLTAQSVAAPAPEFSAAVTGAVIALWVGGSAPIAILIGAVLWLGLTRIVYTYSRELADAGGMYTLMRSGLGERAALVGSFMYLVGYVVYVPGLSLLGGYLLQSALAGIFPHAGVFTGTWVPWAVGFAVIACLLVYRGIRISVRAILAVSIIGITSLTILAIVILAKGGAHGIAWRSLLPWDLPKSVSFSSLLLGVGLGTNLLIGSETAVFLAEEAHAPRKMVPKAVLGAVILLTLFYLLFALGVVSGYGFGATGKAWSTASGNAVAGLSDRYMFKAYGDLLLVLLAVSGLSSSIGVANGCSRMIFAWGRLGIVPSAAGVAHRKHRTPHVAVIGIFVFSMAMLLAGFIWKGGADAAATTIYAWVLIAGTLLLLIGFIFVAISALVKGQRTRPGILDAYIAPGVTLVGMALVVYGNIHPFPPAPFNTAPIAVLIILALAIVFAFWRRPTRPPAPLAREKDL